MVEDLFEVSMQWPGRSFGTAGGVHLQLNRVVQQPKERSPETFGFETRAERDLMQVLHRPIEPRVISGHGEPGAECPLWAKKQTVDVLVLPRSYNKTAR